MRHLDVSAELWPSYIAVYLQGFQGNVGEGRMQTREATDRGMAVIQSKWNHCQNSEKIVTGPGDKDRILADICIG